MAMETGAVIGMLTGESGRADLCRFQTHCATMNQQRQREAPVPEEPSAEILTANAAKADETKGTT